MGLPETPNPTLPSARKTEFSTAQIGALAHLYRGEVYRSTRYLVRQRSDADGRSVTLRLKDKGKKALARDPFEVVVRAVDALDVEEQTAMHDALHQVLTTVAASGARRRFGVCRDCTYLGGEVCCTSTNANQSAPECLMFGVRIDPKEAGLLCVHYQPKDKHRRGRAPR